MADPTSETRPSPPPTASGHPGGASRSLSLAVLTALREAGIPYLVGGGYAFVRHTGIERPLKDFDVFLREQDWGAAAHGLRQRGIATTLTFPHWLGKAVEGDDFVDIIYGSGNGIAPVDDDWFRFATDDEVLGIPVRLVPVEELIWTKSFVMERERYDGGDVVHLIRVCGRQLDWTRLLARYGDHWQVLLGHLIFFGFVYPSERELVPSSIMEVLLDRLRREMTGPRRERICRGTLISRAQYLVDIEQWGYIDPRETPRGAMSEAEIEQWTDAIENPGA